MLEIHMFCTIYIVTYQWFLTIFDSFFRLAGNHAPHGMAATVKRKLVTQPWSYMPPPLRTRLPLKLFRLLLGFKYFRIPDESINIIEKQIKVTRYVKLHENRQGKDCFFLEVGTNFFTLCWRSVLKRKRKCRTTLFFSISLK